VRSAILILLYTAGAVFALLPGGFELNGAIRGGIAAFFLGRAVFSLLLMSPAGSGPVERDRILRSYLVLSYAYVASGVLVGAGALWYGGILGFIAAYAAFSFVWIWFWIRGTLSAAPSDV
jgi:hypothetical protein